MDNQLSVKEAADYITKSNDENGVAHAIYKFVIIDHSPLIKQLRINVI